MSIFLWLFLFIAFCFLVYMGFRDIERLEEKSSINPISPEERLKQEVELMRRQSEIKNLQMRNTALAVWHEMKMQDSQCSMSNADINRTFESCQSCNYCSDKIKREQWNK